MVLHYHLALAFHCIVEGLDTLKAGKVCASCCCAW